MKPQACVSEVTWNSGKEGREIPGDAGIRNRCAAMIQVAIGHRGFVANIDIDRVPLPEIHNWQEIAGIIGTFLRQVLHMPCQLM